MSRLPTAIHSAEQIRAMDRLASERYGIPSYTLMSRAGAYAFKVLRERWPKAKHITVICGSGNNAGDGYVVARLGREAGLKVTTVALFDPASLRGDALRAFQDFSAAGGGAIEWFDHAITRADVIVDAIFGTGLSRALDPQLQARIHEMNAAGVPVFALDIPTGIDANTGQVLGAALKADCTATFVGLKLGFYVGAASDYIGELEFAGLDIPPCDAEVGIAAERIDDAWLAELLPRRSRLAHKGSSGHVLLVGGGKGMAGAIRLAGEACLRVGSGLVTVATCDENVSTIVTDRPELIVRAVTRAEDLSHLIAKASVIAVGPGLGQSEWSRALVDSIFDSDKPLVVDADALNLLAVTPQQKANWILTPHPGEAGRLLACTTEEIQRDRLGSARALVKKFRGIAVLKGANTCVVAEGRLPSICDRGNPGMATPGMGDVLTGVIAGLLAQVIDPWSAARAGVLVHALAGDRAAAHLGPRVERGLIASDLFPELPMCVNFHDR
jgi:hydroxyethylthiazole kinase-like uncharacterized protein yjeF